MSLSKNMRGRPLKDRPAPHRYDEFPAGYSLAGCAPAEPASTSPASAHLATKHWGSTIESQRTANRLLTACLSPRDNPNLSIQCIYPKLSKRLIDEIDCVLAEHFGFNDEELDFLINYDIKYRMGEELEGD